MYQWQAGGTGREPQIPRKQIGSVVGVSNSIFGRWRQKDIKGKPCLKKIRWGAIDEDSSRPQGRAEKKQKYLKRKLRSAAGSVRGGATRDSQQLLRADSSPAVPLFADSGPYSAERLQGVSSSLVAAVTHG